MPYHQLPAVSEQQIASFLDACRPIVGVPVQTVGITRTTDPEVIAANEELSGGIEAPQWFAALPPDRQSDLLRACFSVLENRDSDPRDRWLRALFGACDAEQLGCQDAREIALGWSEQGASWKGEVDFDTTWNSYKPGRVGVGTLLAMAREQGLDLSPWRDSALKPLPEGSCTLHAGSIAPSPPVALPQARQALAVGDLPLVPMKRRWLYGTAFVRGAVTLLVAPGARGKTSFLIAASLACASGRPLLGIHVFGGPLRVLLVNAEDATAEVALRVRASMQYHGLTDADVPGLHVAGADRFVAVNVTASHAHEKARCGGAERALGAALRGQ